MVDSCTCNGFDPKLDNTFKIRCHDYFVRDSIRLVKLEIVDNNIIFEQSGKMNLNVFLYTQVNTC